MTDSNLFASLGLFTGLNTVDDAVRLRTEVVQVPEGYRAAYPLIEAMNVDIDNTYALSSRTGIDEKLTGTNLHSFWANEAGTLCYFMDDTLLYRMFEDYSQSLIDTLISAHRMSFAEFNDKIYYTNTVDIGYILNDTQYEIAQPSEEYKEPLPAGRFICVHKGRLYVAKDNILFIADVLSDHYDVRYGYRVFNSDITMLLSVDDGFYVSDENTWFLSPKDVLEHDNIQLQRDLVDSASAVPYTGIRVPAEKIAGGLEGIVGMWASENGICIGSKNGQVKNITEPKFVMAGVSEGDAMLRDIDGIAHYITTLRG